MCRIKDAIIEGTYYQSKAGVSIKGFETCGWWGEVTLPVAKKVEVKPIRDEGMQYDEMRDNQMTLDWY